MNEAMFDRQLRAQYIKDMLATGDTVPAHGSFFLLVKRSVNWLRSSVRSLTIVTGQAFFSLIRKSLLLPAWLA